MSAVRIVLRAPLDAYRQARADGLARRHGVAAAVGAFAGSAAVVIAVSETQHPIDDEEGTDAT